MSQLPRYDSYKDSGVQWLGEIPSHWEVWKITHAMDLIGSGTTPKSDNLDYYDGDVLWVTTSELRESYIYNTKQKITEIAISDYSVLKKYPIDSVAIAMYGATIGRLGILAKEATFNQACCVFSGSKVLNHKFLYYWLWMRRPILISLSNGGGQPNLSQDDLKKLKLALPPIAEQKVITDFLDKRLAQVDALIAKQETLLEKLAEQRVALISHAVTKGLNPDVEMKDSGVEWFNSVPQHWTISKLSYSLNAVGDVDHYMPESLDDQGVPYVMTGDLKELVSDIDFEQCKQVSHDDYLKLSKKIKTTKGDIIFARYATIGTLSYVDIEKEFLVSYSCVTIKSNLEKLLGTYLYYYFKSDAFFKEVQKQINTNTQGNVGIDNLRRIKVLLPPLSEQEEIVDFLNIETRKIDDMKEVVEKTIERFKEYRSTLITQVVTGKIDVRNLKVN